MQNSFYDLATIDKEIDTIYQSILKVMESTNLIHEAKKDIIRFKSERIKQLLDQKTELGWTDTRGKNLLIMELDGIEKGLNVDIGQELIRPISKQSIEPTRLSDEVPKDNRRLKPVMKIAKCFEEKSKVPNYILAQCITPTIISNTRYKKLSKTEYKRDKVNYDNKIKNRLRTLNGYIEPARFKVKFHSEVSELSSI